MKLCLCSARIPRARAALGYTTCLSCGEAKARTVKHTVILVPKSNYVFVRDYELLKSTNPKRQQEN